MVLKKNCESPWQGAGYPGSQIRYHADRNEAYPCSMIIGLFDRLRNDVELTKKNFKEVGITSAIEEKIEPVDPFKDLD